MNPKHLTFALAIILGTMGTAFAGVDEEIDAAQAHMLQVADDAQALADITPDSNPWKSTVVATIGTLRQYVSAIEFFQAQRNYPVAKSLVRMGLVWADVAMPIFLGNMLGS